MCSDSGALALTRACTLSCGPSSCHETWPSGLGCLTENISSIWNGSAYVIEFDDDGFFYHNFCLQLVSIKSYQSTVGVTG